MEQQESDCFTLPFPLLETEDMGDVENGWKRTMLQLDAPTECNGGYEYKGSGYRFICGFKYFNDQKTVYAGLFAVTSEKDRKNGDGSKLRVIRLSAVPPDLLKQIGIWEHLPEAAQTKITANQQAQEQKVAMEGYERMAHARKFKTGKGRRPSAAFIHIPKELTCSVCGETKEQQRSVTNDQAKRAGQEIDLFIKTWLCRVCKKKMEPPAPAPEKLPKPPKPPKSEKTSTTTTPRGRKPNPEFIGLPKHMVCKCGKEVIVNPNYLKAKAAKNKTTIMQLIESFVCQDCHPTKGRPKKVHTQNDVTH